MKALPTWERLSTKTRIVGISLVATYILYMIHVRFLLIPMLVAVNVLYLPLPRIFRSWFGRTFVSVMVVMLLAQIAGTVQFIAFRNSGFGFLTFMTVLLQVGLLFLTPRPTVEKRKFFDSNDLGGLLTAAFFVAPFLPIFLGSNTFIHIAEMGGFQVVDAAHHYIYIGQMTQTQHLNYVVDNYYPEGFHLTVAWVQQAFFGSYYKLGWEGNALLYFGQYIIFGAMLSMAAYAFCTTLFASLKTKAAGVAMRWQHVLLALCLGPVLALLYTIPLMAEGFLNYLYVGATALLGCIFLIDIRGISLKDPMWRWGVAAYLLFVYGVTVNWPLLTPALMATVFLFFVPVNKNPFVILKGLLTWKNSLIFIAFAIQLLPILFQLKYSHSSEKLNESGAVHDLHYLVLAAGMALVLLVSTGRKLDAAYRRLLFGIFVPFMVLVGVISLVQYFGTGEIRYYPAKSSRLLEIMLFAFGVAFLVHKYLQTDLRELRYLVWLPLAPLLTMLLLVSTLPNPLRESRELFKPHSGLELPVHYAHDAGKYIELGKAGKLKHFNAFILHYDTGKKAFYTYEQLAFWGNVMQEDSTPDDIWGWRCEDYIYAHIAYAASGSDQPKGLEKIKRCAGKSHQRGQDYYIVTDKASVPYLQQVFGDVVTVIY